MKMERVQFIPTPTRLAVWHFRPAMEHGSMNAQAHRWWDMAYFSLKWIGVLPGEFDRVDARNRPVKYTNFVVEWYWLSGRIADALQDRLTDVSSKDYERTVRLEPNDGAIFEALLGERRPISVSTKGAI